MFIRMIQAEHHAAGAHPTSGLAPDTSIAGPNPQPEAAHNARAGSISGLITMAHHGFMALGLAAIGALTLMFVRPDFSDHIKTWSPFASRTIREQSGSAGATAPLRSETGRQAVQSGPSVSEFAQNDIVEARRFGIWQKPAAGTVINEHVAAILEPKNLPAANSHEQTLVTNWLARKYRLAGDATNMLVSAAYVTAKDIKLDPLLILSVVAIESGFNPFAESPLGAQGLMQVMSKIHQEKFQRLGGVKAALNPVANIKVGSSILKDYMTRGGSVEAGLKMYVGASAFDNDAGYGSKVMAEYRRLKEVAVGKSVPVTTTTASTYANKPKAPVQQADTPPAVPATASPVMPPPQDPVANAEASMAAL